MRGVVWKYDIGMPGAPFAVQMPRRACVVSVHVQGEQPRMWAIVDPEQPLEQRVFVVVATGATIPDTKVGAVAAFVGTFLVGGGDLVFHLFEVKP